jgi:DNA helicase-2/ATP-dependent DNA helicase PcrA
LSREPRPAPTRAVPPKAGLDQLNDSQREAVTAGDGPLLILAGAGSGKTRVLTHRIAYLLRERGVPPDAIFAVTFTNKAAEQMRSRVADLAGAAGRAVWVSTFHSACVRMLRAHADRLGLSRAFTIADDDATARVIREVLREMGMDEKALPPRRVESVMSRAKNALVGPAQLREAPELRRDPMGARLVQAYEMYEKLMRERQSLDFDDLLLFAVRLLDRHPEVLASYHRMLSHFLVDEYQDTNHAQYQLIRLLAAKSRNLCVVGDDDQSIYRWRGADVANILSFEKDFPDAKVVTLGENYRSTANILEAAASLIRHNRGRKEKPLTAMRPAGDKVVSFAGADERDEAEFVASAILSLSRREGLRPRDFAVFYRINAQSRALEDALRKFNLPYVIVGGTRFYDRREIRDLMAYLRLLVNPADWGSFLRVLNAPPRGIGDTSEQRLLEMGRSRGLSPEDAAAAAVAGGVLPRKGAQALAAFAAALETLRGRAESLGLSELIVAVLADTGYLPALEREGTEEARGRIENLQEFLSVADDFLEEQGPGERPRGLEGLAALLDRVSLSSDVDSWEDKNDAATLMTLHTAKGLEFPVVFLAGMEEDLLPHHRSQGEPEELEEERRLCYVGMTRAKERLFLTLAGARRMFGRAGAGEPSRFLGEIDPARIEAHPDSAFPLSCPPLDPIPDTPPSAPGKGPRMIPIAEFFYQEPADEDTPFVPGRSVRHPLFGLGQVMSVEGSGPDARVTVYFSRAGKKRLVARYANLQPMPDRP